MKDLRIAFMLAALMLSAASFASGQAPPMSAERRQAILDYPLTLPRANSLITAIGAMTRYVVSLPDYKERMRKAATMTPAENLARVENDPKAMAILKQNGLTAREYLIGVPTLNMAMLAAAGLNTPNIVASPANVAFCKANMAELKPKLDAVNGLTTAK